MKQKPGKELLVVSLIALSVFLASIGGIIPSKVGALQLDILLYIFTFGSTGFAVIIRSRKLLSE